MIREDIKVSQLTTAQIKDIAQTVAFIQDTIAGFYSNPENERAYQEWYLRKYGHTDKESTYD